MEKKLADFISEKNFRFKEELSEAIAKEMKVQMPKPVAEMSLVEILAVVPQMQEWLLYRIVYSVNMQAAYFDGYNLYEDDKAMFLHVITHSAVIDKYVMGNSIPVLLKERWKQYVRSNS